MILSEVRRSVNTMGNVSASESIPKAIQDLEARVQHLEGLAKSLRDEYEMMTAEVGLQREVALRLFTQARVGTPLSTLRQLEGEIRLQIINERKAPDGSAA